MTSLFHKIEGAQAITRRKGLYRQVDVYGRDGAAYVRHGSGFLRLRGGDRTSDPDTFLEGLDLPPGVTRRDDAPRGLVYLMT